MPVFSEFASRFRGYRARTVVAGLGALTILGQGSLGQTLPAGPFTAQQAAAGRAAYQANCAACHQADLTGRNEAPQLAGADFIRVWGGRTAGALVTYIQASMPPGNPGGLGPEAYANIGAFILQANGAVPGSQTLTPSSNASIRSIANGQTPAAIRQEAPAGPQPPAAPVLRGLTVNRRSEELRAGLAIRCCSNLIRPTG